MKKPERFLLVDDDPFNNEICNIALTNAFINPEIVEFTEPIDALAYIEAEYAKNPVNTVLFLDINMPLLSGWEVLDKFKNFPDSIKKHFVIFVLSSSIAPQDKQKAKENPLVTDYLEKPVTKQQLLDMFTD